MYWYWLYYRDMNGRSTSSIKMKKDLFTLKEMCVKLHRNMSCRNFFQNFQKLQLQKLISLNLHHLSGTITTLIWRSVWKIYTPKKNVFKRVLIWDLFQKIQMSWVFHIPVWKKWIWVLKNESFLRLSVWVLWLMKFDYSSIEDGVWACTFMFWVENYPLVYLTNVTPVSKRNPIALLLVEKNC